MILLVPIVSCYQCGDREQCDDKNKEEMTEKECAHEPAVMCVQFIETKGAQVGQVVRRDCAVGNADGEHVNGQVCFVRDGSSLEMCICQTSLCNGNLPPCSIRRFGHDGEQGKGKGCKA